MGEIYSKDKSQPLEELLFEFAKKNGLELSNNLDIISVCKILDISVKKFSTKKDGYDGFILINDKHKVIGMDETLSPLDRRFLIAHELGHYIMADSEHSNVLIALKDNLIHGSDKAKVEHDADYLAAALLVPMKQFKRELDLLDINYKNFSSEQDVKAKIPAGLIEFFAKRYRVTEQLITRRFAEVSEYA